MIKYAYTYQGCLVGFSERQDLKLAGEINPKGSEWYTPETPVKRCPQGDEMETPYDVKARWELQKQEEEKLFESYLNGVAFGEKRKSGKENERD